MKDKQKRKKPETDYDDIEQPSKSNRRFFKPKTNIEHEPFIFQSHNPIFLQPQIQPQIQPSQQALPVNIDYSKQHPKFYDSKMKTQMINQNIYQSPVNLLYKIHQLYV